MILRQWHGKVPESKSDAYQEYMLQTGIPDYHSTKGNLGAYFLRRGSDSQVHFVMLSLWESLDAIKNFAGEDIERARYYPKDKEFLIELEPKVLHYEVLLAPDKGGI